ncbi:hypothetical protein PGC35_18635 [Psychrobacillus sp. PGGUH221]|uniref:hypothetical protein n=1 Tax=Psychrobacillus sp. PGGUH221 TaxID=3020058 RepID=UPI0035C72F4C
MILKSKKNFTTSVNLKFDIGNKEFIRRYLPTPSHADFLKGIIGGFLGENKHNAHVMIGPYGSGKSLVATIVANIFSGNINEREFKLLINKFKNVDQEIYEKLLAAYKFKSNFIPIILSGNEGSFGRTIISAIYRGVKNAGYELIIPGEMEEINTILKKWETKFPKTFNEFKKSLKIKGLTFNQWKKELQNNNQIEIDWFKKEYSVLSAGAIFQVNYENNFLEKITQIIEQLKEKNLQIFIAYDEFGRFLQSLEISQVYKTMQDLQDLAEIATRSNNLLQVLLISHKNMSQYILSQNAEYKSEFQRIEKRFHTYFIESDKATFYRIAQEYTKNLQEELLLLNIEAKDSKWILKKYNLFNELNHQEIEKLIVEGSYPIHPLALFLLPRLSSIFGQNERTLFTFLESEDTGGLNNFIIKQKNEMYYPHMLFDYFFQNSISEFMKDESFEALKTFAKLTNKIKISKDKSGQLNILKLVTLWELSNSNNVVKLNKELFMYGTGQKEDELEKNLDELIQLKLLRFNRILNQWELNEGSSIIVEELVESERATLLINEETRINEISELLKKKFYLATDYNDEKSITRFMQVRIITSVQLLKENFVAKNSFNSDGILFFVIPTSQEAFNESLLKIKNFHNEQLIFAITNRNFTTIKSALDRLIFLKSIFSNKKLLSEHNKLQEEINILIEEIRFEIIEFLNDFESFKENVQWYYVGEQISLYHEVELENKISDIMYNLFPQTPEIRNDSINRRNLNGMQTKAIYSVLNGVIKYPNFGNLGIQGQGPDYLIYATVFKNNDFDISNLNNIKYEPYKLIRNRVLSFIQSQKKGTVLEIEEIFTSHPFGVRKPLVPLLFVALLRDQWDQLMFYRNNMYVTAVDAEKLYGIFENSAEYEFVFHDYSKEFLEFINNVETIFQPYVSEYVLDQTTVIRASSGILNWLRQLPRHTQITEQLDSTLLDFKNTIRKVEVNPLENLQLMYKKYYERSILLEMKIHLEKEFESFKKEVLLKLLEAFQVYTFEELTKKYASYTTEEIKRNRLLKSIDKSSNSFIEDFALNYTGVELVNWSDTTFDLFERQVQNDYMDTLQSSTSNDSILIGLNDMQKSIKKVELSTKSQTIYDNVNRMIRNAGRNVPREEIEYLVYKLLDEFID